MRSSLRLIFVVLVFLLSLNSWGASDPVLDKRIQLNQLNKKIQELIEQTRNFEVRITEDQATVDSLKAKGADARTIANFQSGLEARKKRRDELVAEATKVQDTAFKIEKEIEALRNLKPGDLTAGQFKLEAKHLLMKSENVRGLVDNQGMKLDNLYSQLDNTLLGMYMKDSAEKALAKFKGKPLCDAVAKCQSNQAMNKEIAGLKSQAKSLSESPSFKQWLEQVKAGP